MKTASGDVASNDVSSSEALCLQMLQAFYLLITLLSFVLSEPMLLKIDTTFLSLVLHT